MGRIALEDIKQYHRESNNCFQDVVGMILYSKGLNPFDMYWGSLNLGYNRRESLFGNRLVPSRDGMWLDCSLLKNLYKIDGLAIEKKTNVDYSELMKDVENNKYGIIMEVDVFNCSWHRFYNKIHCIHYCLLTNVDTGKFVFALPFGKKMGIYKIETDSFNYYRYFFEKRDKKYIGMDILFDTLRECRGQDNSIRDIELLEQFRDDVSQFGINLEAEREGYAEIISIPLVRAIEWVLWSRINYRDVLIEYDNDGVLKPVISKLESLIDAWKGIKNFTIIEFMRNHKYINKDISYYIDEAIELEKELINVIDEVCLEYK